MAKEPQKPAQPTIQTSTAKPESQTFMRTNDPVTNEAERKKAQDEGAEEERVANEEQQRQEEEAKRQEEEEKQRIEVIQSITKSNEGFVVVEDSNRDGIELARVAGHVYVQNVQSGPGGLDVEERVFLSKEGQDAYSAHRLAQLDK